MTDQALITLAALVPLVVTLVALAIVFGVARILGDEE